MAAMRRTKVRTSSTLGSSPRIARTENCSPRACSSEAPSSISGRSARARARSVVSSSMFTGLVRYSVAPALSASTAVAMSAWPVRTKMGTWRSAARTRRVTSTPLGPGITRSVITASGGSSERRASSASERSKVSMRNRPTGPRLAASSRA